MNKSMTVENMTNSKGNIVKHQFLIYGKDSVTFQSYTSTIAVKNLKTGVITLDANKWDYSVTTGKFRNIFLNEGIAETRKKIDSKEYKLKDLN